MVARSFGTQERCVVVEAVDALEDRTRRQGAGQAHAGLKACQRGLYVFARQRAGQFDGEVAASAKRQIVEGIGLGPLRCPMETQRLPIGFRGGGELVKAHVRLRHLCRQTFQRSAQCRRVCYLAFVISAFLFACTACHGRQGASNGTKQLRDGARKIRLAQRRFQRGPRKARAQHVTDALAQLMRFVHHRANPRENVVLQALQAHDRIKDVVVVADHDIGPGRDIQRQLEGADAMTTGNLFNLLPTHMAAFEQFTPRRRHPLVVAMGVLAELRVAGRIWAEADPFLGGDGDGRQGVLACRCGTGFNRSHRVGDGVFRRHLASST